MHYIALRTGIWTFVEIFASIDNSIQAVGQKNLGELWEGIKHEWEPNLHLVPIPLVRYRSL